MDDLVFTEPTQPLTLLAHDAFVTPRADTSARTTKSAAQTAASRQILTLRRQARWLGAFAVHGIVGEACREANLSRETVHRWEAEDEVFAGLKRSAYEDAKDAAEMELHRRAVRGVDEPRTVAGEREVVRKYSDTLLLARVKALKPQVYDRQPSQGAVNVQVNTLVVPIERLSDEQFALLEQIYGKAGPPIQEVPQPGTGVIEGVVEVEGE